MDSKHAAVGNVVQVKPNAGTLYDGCLMVITKVSRNGFDGMVVAPRTSAQANRGEYNIHKVGMPYNLVEHVGTVVWDVK